MSAKNTKAGSGHEQAVREVVRRLYDARNRHDMASFGALFAPDADFVNVAGTHWKGREAIRLNHAFLHGTVPVDSPGVTLPKGGYGIFKTSKSDFEQIDVRFLRSEVAVAHIRWEMLGNARIRDPRRGLMVLILTQDAGRWLIAVAQNTEINRPPELR